MTTKLNYMTEKSERIFVPCDRAACEEEVEIGFEDVEVKIMSGKLEVVFKHTHSCVYSVITSHISLKLFRDLVMDWFVGLNEDCKRVDIFNKLTFEWQKELRNHVPVIVHAVIGGDSKSYPRVFLDNDQNPPCDITNIFDENETLSLVEEWFVGLADKDMGKDGSNTHHFQRGIYINLSLEWQDKLSHLLPESEVYSDAG